MTVTRWPHATQRETWPYRFVPVPPPWGCVQSRSVSSRMCRGRSIRRSYPTDRVPYAGARDSLPGASSPCSRPPLSRRPAAAHAQGAGDDQYQDPFARRRRRPSRRPRPDQRAESRQQQQPRLSTAPPAQSAPAQTRGALGTPPPAAAAGSALPYTGAEIPAMALLGLGLLGLGVGLRLRTADETLF